MSYNLAHQFDVRFCSYLFFNSLLKPWSSSILVYTVYTFESEILIVFVSLLQLLIGYENGTVVLWDLRSKRADLRAYYDEVSSFH